MNTVDVDYGYKVEQFENGCSFSIQRKRFGPATFILFWVLSLVLALVPGAAVTGISAAIGLLRGTTEAQVVVTLVIATILSGAALYFVNKRRKWKQIVVGPDYLEVDKSRYERRHIAELYAAHPDMSHTRVRPDLGFQVMGASGALGLSGVAAAGANAAQAGASEIGGTLKQVVNSERGSSVWMHYGAKPVRLAKGLNKISADLLARDIGRALGMTA